MRPVALLTCGLVQWWIAVAAHAAPCASQSLADYLALGAGGCTVSDVTFSDFSEGFPLPPGAVSIDVDSVVLTPVTGPGGTGFSIDTTAPIVAGPGDLLSLWFGFRVSGGSGFVGNAITLGPPTVTGDGAITLVADVCRDGSFIAPSFGCLGSPEVEIAFAIEGDSGLADSDAFAVSSFFDVFVDLVIDGGLGGSAQLGPQLGTVRAQQSVASVPAPGSALLMAAALLMLWAPIRRAQFARR